MEQKKQISEEVRRGRKAAAGLLVSELFTSGDRLASFLGMSEWYNYVAIPRLVIGLCIFLYYFVIQKPRLVCRPQWYVLLGQDTLMRVLWTLDGILLLSSIGT